MTIIGSSVGLIPAPIPSPMSISGLAAWYRLDSRATVSGGNLTALGDLSGNGHNLTKIGGGAYAYTTADSRLNNRHSVAGAAAGTYLSTNTAVVLNASARTVIVIGYVNNTISGGGTVCQFGTNSPVSNAFLYTSLGSGANTYTWTDDVSVDNHQIGNSLTINEPFCLIETILPGRQVTFQKNGVDSTTSQIGPSSAADGGTYFEFMSRLSGNLPWAGNIAELIVYNRILTDSEVRQVKQYVTQRYAIKLGADLIPDGNTLITSLAPDFWLDADTGIILSGSNVTSWTDKTGGAVLATFDSQVQGTFNATDSNYAGRPSVSFTQFGVQNSTALEADASFTQLVLTVPGSAADSYKSLFQVTNGRIYARMNTASWGVYNTGDVLSGSTLSAGTKYALVTLSSAANNVTFRTNGTANTVLTGTSYIPNPGLNVIVGGYAQAAQPYDGTIACALYWRRVLSAGEILQLSLATRVKWGQPC